MMFVHLPLTQAVGSRIFIFYHRNLGQNISCLELDLLNDFIHHRIMNLTHLLVGVRPFERLQMIEGITVIFCNLYKNYKG